MTRPPLTANRLLILCILLAGCGTTAPIESETVPEGLGEVTLQRATSTPLAEQLLDVGIVIFEAASDSDSGSFGDWVFAEVRDNERHLLPYILKNTLQESAQWGAVRVLPEADPSVHLSIIGTVLQSDGQQLELRIQAKDATGRIWLDRLYYDRSDSEGYLPPRTLRRVSEQEMSQIEEPFLDIYEQISNDVLAARNQLTTQDLETIANVALLVYAEDLSPDAFGYMLNTDTDGQRTLASLPATDDPMLQRVQDMRTRHHLFIDTVDEYYQALHDQTRAPYMIWRSYSSEQLVEEQRVREREQGQGERQEREADQSRYSSTSGYLTLTQRYDRYRWSKIYQQEYQELAAGFNREAAPAILELNRQVHGLNGTLEEQYSQWRRILRELFSLENGQ